MKAKHVRSASEYTIASVDFNEKTLYGRITKAIVVYLMREIKRGHYPLPSVKTVLPVTYITGLLCICIGAAIVMANQNVRFLSQTYYKKPQGNISIQFNLDVDWEGDVYLFYKLEGFYANHRAMQKSYCEKQYAGEISGHYDNSSCSPVGSKMLNKRWTNTTHVGWDNFIEPITKKIYAPMGALANAMFNDTFRLAYTFASGEIVDVPFSSKGIITAEEEKKYMKTNSCNDSVYANTVKPRAWTKHICEMQDGYQNVDFVVWMRDVGYSTFMKIYRKIDRKQSRHFKTGLPKGNYTMHIENNFLLNSPPCIAARQNKYFVLLKPSWYGHEDRFLNILCFVVGLACIISAIVMTYIHIKYGKTMEEISEMDEEKSKEL